MSIPLPQRQHEDIKECLDLLKSADDNTILTLAAACDHDSSFLLELRLFYDSIPEYSDDEAQNIKNNAQQRRNRLRDWFSTGKILSIVYSQQQRQVLKQIFDKYDQIQQFRQIQSQNIQNAQLVLKQQQSSSTKVNDGQLIDPSLPPPPTPPTPPTPPQFRLFVGGVDSSTTDQEFRTTFLQFPALKYSNMPVHHVDKTKKRGFGFVEFETYFGLDSCLTHHQNSPIRFRGKQVDIQIPKDNIVALQEWLALQQTYELELTEYIQKFNPSATIHSTITGNILGSDTINTNNASQLFAQMNSNASVGASMNDLGDGSSSSMNPNTNDIMYSITDPTVTILQDIPSHQLPPLHPNGFVLCIANMFPQNDKNDVDEGELTEDDLKEEVLPKFQQFGTVTNTLLRFSIGVQARDDNNEENTYYPVFVQYASHEEAAKALQGLGGLVFDSRKLYAYLTSEIPQ